MAWKHARDLSPDEFQKQAREMCEAAEREAWDIIAKAELAEILARMERK